MLDVSHYLLAAVLVAPSAWAGEDEPRADNSPTAWSCTVDTLLSGQECVFETEAPPAASPDNQAVENARQATKLAERACSIAARRSAEPIPDPSVLAACKPEFVEKAMACGTDGTYPLLDSSGRFSPGTRVCYFAMAEVLARTRFMADASAKCCRCLVASGCLKSGAHCNHKAASGQLAASACLQNQCAESCGAFIPDPGRPQPPVLYRPEAPPELPAKRLLREGKMNIQVPGPQN